MSMYESDKPADQTHVSVFIHHIETSVPRHAYRQEEVSERMKTLVAETERQQRIIQMIYSRSGIEKRHSVMSEDDSPTAFQKLFEAGPESPGTAFRNRIFETEARKLFVETAGKLIENSSFEAESVTHLVTVSCTGFYAPGPDYDIVKALGMSGNVQRFHLGFMGCYAGITALKLASQLCESEPENVVMVVTTELCTLHFQRNAETDNLISTSVFADGSSGAIVSGKPPSIKPALEITGFVSDITEEGEKDMAWTIGDTGFQMVLSTYIPDILSGQMERFLEPVFDRFALSRDQISHWAIHPGGRAILDKVEKQLKLPGDALTHSRAVLRDYGNMSSATILFVLKALLDAEAGTDSQQSDKERMNSGAGQSNRGTSSGGQDGRDYGKKRSDGSVLALAFGPGLTIESGLFQLHRPKTGL